MIWWRKTGRLVDPGFVIHHKDGNTCNNVFSNLEQIESKKHVSHHSSSCGYAVVKLCCPVCESVFIRRRNNTHLVKKQLRTFCSKRCSGLFSNMTENEKQKVLKIENVICCFKERRPVMT